MKTNKSKYAEIVLVGPNAIKMLRFSNNFEKDRNWQKLFNEEFDGIVIDDFKTFESYSDLVVKKKQKNRVGVNGGYGRQFAVKWKQPAVWTKEEKIWDCEGCGCGAGWNKAK